VGLALSTVRAAYRTNALTVSRLGIHDRHWKSVVDFGHP
jgi:hypothetical protein